MTVCIAAACFDGSARKIVLCTDWQRSTALGSADTMFKQIVLPQNWMCLPTGYESEIMAIVHLLRQEFAGAEMIDETNIASIIRRALNARKKEKADEYINDKYALSYDAFLDIGSAKFPPELHRNALLEVSALQLQASFIIVGFISGFPYLLKTDEKCAISMQEEFVTIGEGSYLATASLLQRQYMDVTKLHHALYCVYEAKRHAERVASVGQYTSISVFSSDGTVQLINDKGEKSLGRKYKQYSPKAVPGNINIGEGIIDD